MSSAIVKLASLWPDGDSVGIPDPSGDVHFQPTSVQEHGIVGLQGICRSEKVSHIWKEVISLSFTLARMFYCLTLVINVLPIDKTLLFQFCCCCYTQTLTFL